MGEITLRIEDVDKRDGPIVIAAAGTLTKERFFEPPHRHSRGQLIGSMRGLLSLGVEKSLWIVPAIHAIWVPPQQLHSVKSHGDFHGWSAFVSPAACASLPDRPCTLRTSPLLREAVLRAATWAAGTTDAARQRVGELIVDEIKTMPAETHGLPLPREARLSRIAQAFIADPSDLRDLDAWARWAGISSRTLSRRFVAETGFTFTRWKQRARLLRSLEMLAAGMPVTTIALDLGYSTGSAFISLFARVYGVTPAVYRRNLQHPLPA